MTSDSIWIILCYSGIILYAVCSSGFHAEGFLNALTCFSMFLRWNPCKYTEASPCSASFSSDSFNLSKACSAEDLLPSKANTRSSVRYHISISRIFKQFQNSLATDNTRIDRIIQNLGNAVCMIAIHHFRHLRHKLKCFALYCLCIVLFICIVITTIADFLNPVIHTVIHKRHFQATIS